MRLLAGLVTTAIAFTMIVPGWRGAVNPASAAPACERQSKGTTDLTGLVGTAQPVILVHGWTSRPMDATRTELEGLPSKNKRQYFTFDYEQFNTLWASDPPIAACLAAYIKKVSDTHRQRGGTGRVFLVAHSMGGLAIRFALSTTYGGVAGLADRVGGVTTLDTPNTGSMWGGTWVAHMLSMKEELFKGRALDAVADLVPSIQARAWTCLADGPNATWSGCAKPPPLPRSVPLQQVVGEVSLSRSLFGIKAYKIDLGGDVIVPTQSQRAGGDESVSVRCSPGMNAYAAAALFSMPVTDLATTGIFSGVLDTDSPAPLLGIWQALEGLNASNCSHVRITTNPKAIQVVDKALADQAASQGLTKIGPWANRLPVPAACGNPPAVARNGVVTLSGGGEGAVQLDDDEGSAGPVFGDLTGDGLSDAAVVYRCSASGVGGSWPDMVLIYSAGPRLVAAYDFGDLATAFHDHATVASMKYVSGGLEVKWSSYAGAGDDVLRYQGRLALQGSKLRLSKKVPLTPDVEVGPGFIGPLRVGARAQDLAKAGLVGRDPYQDCDVHWRSIFYPDSVWTEFRMGDPDVLDQVFVRLDESPTSLSSSVVTTAEGVGIGQTVRTLQAVYGDRLVYGQGFPAEGEPYDAYVLFGRGGALMFMLSGASGSALASRRTVTSMAAVRGTTMKDLEPWFGGC